MKNDWIAAYNIERAYNIISDINVISVHAKLFLAGADYTIDRTELHDAREHLVEFITQLNSLVQVAEQSSENVVLGTDPRLGELARKFTLQKQRRSQQSVLYSISFDKLNELVNSEEIEELPELISLLRELRSMLEQHLHSDINHIHGDL